MPADDTFARVAKHARAIERLRHVVESLEDFVADDAEAREDGAESAIDPLKLARLRNRVKQSISELE